MLLRCSAAGPARAALLALLVSATATFAFNALLFTTYGEGCQAWKGAIWFQTFAPAPVLAVLLLSADRILAVTVPSPQWAVAVVALPVALAWGEITLATSRPGEDRYALMLDSEIEQLSVAERAFPIRELNIAIKGPKGHWYSMWATYFIDRPSLTRHRPAPAGTCSTGPSPWTIRP